MRAARAGAQSGLTLIELVVAMAIFSLIAVMGLQALTGAMRMRDRLTEIDAGTARLGMALSLLRADLGALVPLLFHPPDGPPTGALSLDPQRLVLGLSLSGQPDLRLTSGVGLQRAEWHLDTAAGVLSRRVWPVLNPANSDALSPEMDVIDGVSGWSVRTYWPEIGWVAGVSSGLPVVIPLPEEADGDRVMAMPAVNYSSALPMAVELTLQTSAFGEIVLIEALQ